MQAGHIARALSPALDPLQPQIPAMQARVVPSAFDGNDTNLRAVPLPLDWSWPSLGVYLKSLNAEIVVSQLPTFWQLGPYVFYAARSMQVPLITLDMQNYPLDKAAVLYAGATTVLAEPHEAGAIVSYLRDANVELPRGFILVHAADAPDFAAPAVFTYATVAVAHEVHLFPGVPLLVQCEHVCTQSRPVFHFAGYIEWDGNTAIPTISMKLPTFMVEKLPLPFSLVHKGACACGKPLVARAMRTQ